MNGGSDPTIDAYSHVVPSEYKTALESYTGSSYTISDLHDAIPTLTDVERRLTTMDECGVDVDVLVPASPAVETVADHRGAVELARTMNDGIARIVDEYPDRFAGVATVPMNNPEAMVDELERAVTDLGLCGALIYSNVDRRPADEPHLDGAGRPIDGPEFDPFYEMAAALDVPLWLHPARPKTTPEYVGEPTSKYLVWQMFGWPFELSAAMARMVFGGVFDRHPELDVIAHHAGGMIPLLTGRMDVHYDLFETFSGTDLTDHLSSPYSDQFRRFYVDTATFGSVRALEMAIEFFGVDHVLFGTDAPFDTSEGRRCRNRCRKALDAADLSERDRQRISGGNVRTLIGD
ncbi:amidohydrolase [Natrarchaeobius halalkaliphilus]|uniref:Amidohydrolase n=1 Tax=Natrarchaeobius halalkaliphilus TaxID=1679091 RepID=A0A3N6LYW1_9EURY|nr:amidohydrolase family protein [Natrarchaeobius halalkaliphilus]RQG87883.1 amidohydrolase [Natrarchaeobius halalkaliphilus]